MHILLVSAWKYFQQLVESSVHALERYPPFAADEKRYEAECEAYEAANPGWRSYEARRAAAKAAQQAARLPPAPPPSAEQMFVEAWCAPRPSAFLSHLTAVLLLSRGSGANHKDTSKPALRALLCGCWVQAAPGMQAMPCLTLHRNCAELSFAGTAGYSSGTRRPRAQAARRWERRRRRQWRPGSRPAMASAPFSSYRQNVSGHRQCT